MDEGTGSKPVLRVVIERRKMGLSQAALARAAGINQTSMSKVERGLEPAFPYRGKRIAEALGWEGNPDDLFKAWEEKL